jgi:hypothetical protein
MTAGRFLYFELILFILICIVIFTFIYLFIFGFGFGGSKGWEGVCCAQKLASCCVYWWTAWGTPDQNRMGGMDMLGGCSGGQG